MVRVVTGVDPTCFVFAPAVCVIWDATVNFWELLATILLTALVTVATILVSVRLALKTTRDTLAAAAAAEVRARAERAQQAEIDTRIAYVRELVPLVVQRAQELATAGKVYTESPELGAAWAAIGLSMRISTSVGAADIVEWIDLLLHRDHIDRRAPGASVVEILVRPQPDKKAIKLLERWANDPRGAADSIQQELEELRLWQGAERKKLAAIGKKFVDETFRTDRADSVSKSDGDNEGSAR